MPIHIIPNKMWLPNSAVTKNWEAIPYIAL